MHAIAKITISGLCLVFMTSCSRGPSDAEVESAMKARFTDSDPSDDHAIRLITAKNIRCKSTEEKAVFMCDVEVEMEMPMSGKMESVAQLRMIKSGEAWNYDENQALDMQARPSE